MERYNPTMNRESRAPVIVAIVLLLLPVLYAGSYLAVVVPDGVTEYVGPFPPGDTFYFMPSGKHYRFVNGVSRRVFWPLEQIDRKLRPEVWALENYRHSTGEWPSTYRP